MSKSKKPKREQFKSSKVAAPNWNLDADAKTITISFPTTPEVKFTLNADGIDGLLLNIGDMRGRMKPSVPADFALGQTVKALRNPKWVTEPDAMLGNSLLHLRDPRYGWLHYLIPKDDARKLAGYLKIQADAPSPGPSQGKPS